MSDDSKESFRQKNKNLLVNVTGGPAKIISRPAKVTHGGLGITEGDFKVVADHLKASLDKFKVPKREQDEVFEIILSLKPDTESSITNERLEAIDGASVLARGYSSG